MAVQLIPGGNSEHDRSLEVFCRKFFPTENDVSEENPMMCVSCVASSVAAAPMNSDCFDCQATVVAYMTPCRLRETTDEEPVIG